MTTKRKLRIRSALLKKAIRNADPLVCYNALKAAEHLDALQFVAQNARMCAVRLAAARRLPKTHAQAVYTLVALDADISSAEFATLWLSAENESLFLQIATQAPTFSAQTLGAVRLQNASVRAQMLRQIHRKRMAQALEEIDFILSDAYTMQIVEFTAKQRLTAMADVMETYAPGTVTQLFAAYRAVDAQKAARLQKIWSDYFV